MLKYSTEFFSMSFYGKNMKDAYLKACKWYATNVLSKDELQNIEVSYEKDMQSPTVTIHLYVTIKESDIRDEHCSVCKSVHSKAFCSEDTNCAWCRINGYQNRVDAKIAIKKDYYRDLLNRRLDI